MPGLTPSQRTQRARLAAHTKWAHVDDRTEATRPAREAFNKRFLDDVDPNRELSEQERQRRAGHARKAYFARLSLKSAQARSRKARGST